MWIKNRKRKCLHGIKTTIKYVCCKCIKKFYGINQDILLLDNLNADLH